MNLVAFVAVAGLAFKVATDVATQGTVSALGGFLRADALSSDFSALPTWNIPVGDGAKRTRMSGLTTVQYLLVLGRA